MQNMWDNFVKFLADYDIRKIIEAVQGLDWANLLTSPLFWVVGLSILIFMIWKKQFRTLVLMISVVVFIYLLQTTLPPAGEGVPLHKLIKFIGGSVVLIAINLYFFFVRTG